MRSFAAALSILILLVTQTARAVESPASGFSNIELARELPVNGMHKLLGWSGGNYFFAIKEGLVSVVNQSGKELFVLQAKDNKGNSLLKQPEAVAVSSDTIFVADSRANCVFMFDLQGKYKGRFGAPPDGFFSSNDDALKGPRGIAIHDGVVYVSDTGNERVQLFGSNGIFLTTLEIDSAAANADAKAKDLPYKLNEPTDIAVDPGGQIYVLDADDGLVKVYSPEGAYLKHLPGKVKAAYFTLSHDGIYMADRDSFVISKYDFNDKLVYSFGSRGKGRAQFGNIAGLSTDQDRQVFVGDSEKGIADVFSVESGEPYLPMVRQPSRTSVRWEQSLPLDVDKLAWDGKGAIYGIAADDKGQGNKIVRIVDGKVAGEIRIKDLSPSSITFDGSGFLWVLDGRKGILARLDESGKVLFSFGSTGSHKGELDDPQDFVVSDAGVIIVADSGNHRLQVFSNDGVFLREIRQDESDKLDNPVSVALDSGGMIYVLDKGRSVVSVYSAKGEPQSSFGKQEGKSKLTSPAALRVAQDEVFVLDGNVVKVYSLKGAYIRSFGTSGSDPGEFDGPASITATGKDTFSISERGNKRVQSFTTLYKPAMPQHLVAQNEVHAIELHWDAPLLPYVGQYRIYRATEEKPGNGSAGPGKLALFQIATSTTNSYTDHDVELGRKYYYWVEGESQYGYTGPKSDAAGGTALKYVPVLPEKIQAEASQLQIRLSWQPAPAQYFSAYEIYQKDGDAYTRIAETSDPVYVKTGLAPNTRYTYYIAVRSTDDVESDKAEVSATTLAPLGAPLEINVVRMRDIFSNTYKIYEQEGIGVITLTNNTDKPIEKIKVSFMLSNFMDFPTEEQVDQILPGQSKEVTLKAVFNNNILAISEDSSIQASIEASYFEDSVRKAYSKNPTITVYDKHRMTWDEHERLASFITPKDEPIIGFARSIATQFPDTRDDAQLAAVLFDAMGEMGFTYIQNPIDPYQVSIAKTATTEKTDTVDYVQYPRETMDRKSGDCVDLVSFYATALESVGISTLMLEVPDHLLMMFSTGIDADADGYTMDDLYVIHDGKLWIPVETTVVGKPFAKAWEIGAANYYKWKDKGLNILDIHSAWNTYKPATLPAMQAKPVNVTAAEIDRKFPGDFSSILKIGSQTKTRRYLQAIQKNPNDMDAHLQIGIILAKAGDRDQAMKYFDRILEFDPKNASALNNRGNLYMLQGNYPEAQKSYLAATQTSPNDAYVWVNLARSYKVAKNTRKAREAFIKAQKLDPSVKVKYKALALELLNTL